MKLLELVANDVRNKKAVLFRREIDNCVKEYYNVLHGNSNAGFRQFRMLVSNKIDITNDKSNDEITLIGDNFDFKKFVSKNSRLQYILETSEKSLTNITNNNVLLFWNIPNKYFTHVQYYIDGEYKIIDVATDGFERDGEIYSSPCPIVELYGNAKLTWLASRYDGKREKHEINFDYETGKFSFQDFII